MNCIFHNFSLSLLERESQRTWLENNDLFLGDVHNHCNLIYGYGKLEEAIEFANTMQGGGAKRAYAWCNGIYRLPQRLSMKLWFRKNWIVDT